MLKKNIKTELVKCPKCENGCKSCLGVGIVTRSKKNIKTELVKCPKCENGCKSCLGVGIVTRSK